MVGQTSLTMFNCSCVKNEASFVRDGAVLRHVTQPRCEFNNVVFSSCPLRSTLEQDLSGRAHQKWKQSRQGVEPQREGVARNEKLGGCNAEELRPMDTRKSVKMFDDVWKDLRVHWMPRVKGSGRDGTLNEV